MLLVNIKTVYDYFLHLQQTVSCVAHTQLNGKRQFEKISLFPTISAGRRQKIRVAIQQQEIKVKNTVYQSENPFKWVVLE